MNTDTPTPETDAVDASRHEVHAAYFIMRSHACKLERERDQWQMNALLKLAVKQLACMWCGELVHAPTGYEPGTPLNEEQRAQAHQQHVATCPAHPIRDVERERNGLQRAYDTAIRQMNQAIAKAEWLRTDAIAKLERERDEAREQRAAERELANRLLVIAEKAVWDHAGTLHCADNCKCSGRLAANVNASLLTALKEARSES